MEVIFKIGPGYKVSDTVTGLKGSVDSVLIAKNGNIQCAVQPRSTTTTDRPEGWYLDEEQLTISGSFIPIEEIVDKVSFKYEPGSKAKDSLSGIEGIITSAIYYLNRCKKYSIQPLAKKGEVERPDAIVVDEDDIELIEENKQDVKKKRFNSTGGPAIKISTLR